MKKFKAIISAVLVSSMILGMTACEDTAPAAGTDGGNAAITTTQPSGTGAGTTTDPDANAAIGEESWTQRSAEVMPMVQALVDEYAV